MVLSRPLQKIRVIHLMSIFNKLRGHNSDLAHYSSTPALHHHFSTTNAERRTPLLRIAAKPAAVFGLAVILFGLSLHSANAQKLRIGISMKTLDAPYFAAQGKAAEEEVKKLGGTTISADAQNDMMKQIADVEDMLAKGIDGLILNPKDAQGLVPVTKQCTKAGVPVVIIDSSIDPAADYVTIVQSNNTANGLKVGEWFADTYGDKTPHIALLSGEQGNLVGEDRRDGVFRGIVEAQLRKYGKAGFVVVGQGWGGWTTEGGLKAMEDLLTAHKDIDVVLGENDSMVLGAIKAIQELASNR